MFERLGWGLTGGGAVILLVAGALALHNYRSMEGMELVPARVLRRVDVVTYGINRSRPVVAFRTLAGKDVEFVAMSSLKDEEDVHVLYRIANPQEARIHFGFGEYLVSFILLLMGLGCGGIGMALLKILAEESRSVTPG